MASELIFGRLTNAEDIQDTIQNWGWMFLKLSAGCIQF